MKIKILVSCSGTNFSFQQSETVEVSSELGKDLIAAGYAEELKPKAGAKNNGDA